MTDSRHGCGQHGQHGHEHHEHGWHGDCENDEHHEHVHHEHEHHEHGWQGDCENDEHHEHEHHEHGGGEHAGAAQGLPYVEIVSHEGALAATFELQPQDNQDQAEQLLVNFMEAVAQAVMAAGGIVGHIKATIGHDMLVTSLSTTGGGVNITRPKEVSAAATTRQTAATNRKSGTTPAEHNAPEQSLPPTINVAIIVLMLPKSNLREIIYENLLGTLCPAPLAD